MAFYRCLNDMFGYCKDKPSFVGEPFDENSGGSDDELVACSGRKCQLDSKDCGKYQSITDVYKPVEKE